MVQFVQGMPSRSALQSKILGESIGEGLGNAVNDYFASEALQKVLDDPSLRDKPLSEKLAGMEKALRKHGDAGERMLSRRLAVEQQAQQEAESKALLKTQKGEELTESERAALTPERALKATKSFQEAQQSNKLFDALKKIGVPPDTANAIALSPKSVQSQLVRQFIDTKERSLPGFGEGARRQLEQAGFDLEGAQEEIAPDTYNLDKIAQQNTAPFEQRKPIQFQKIPLPQGLNFKEQAQFRMANRKANDKRVEESVETIQELKREGALVDQLRRLNPFVPSGADKLILNTYGDIRPTAQLLGIPNKETQLYAKTLAEFLSGAQQFFGGRVSNFEVNSFKQKLPGLLNSEDGRRLIVEQMDILNQLRLSHSQILNEAIRANPEASFTDISEQAEAAWEERERDLIGKLDQVVEASNMFGIMQEDPELFGDSVLMMVPGGGFEAVEKDAVEAAEQAGFKKWFSR